MRTEKEFIDEVKKRSKNKIAARKRKIIAGVSMAAVLVCILTAAIIYFPINNEIKDKSENGTTDQNNISEENSGIRPLYSVDLMENVIAQVTEGKPVDDRFIESQLDFYFDLFKASAKYSENENIFVSPMSVMLALSMTANGADGETRAEMEALLGGELTIEELNQYLYAYIKSLPSNDEAKVNIANAIWYENRFNVEESFLETNANYYGASLFRAPFDDKVVDEINNWVKEKTEGLVDRIIERFDGDEVMILLNTLFFESQWQNKYTSIDVYNGEFESYQGDKSKVEYMQSSESLYIEDFNAKGFVKNYKNSRYSFVTLLPNEGVDIYKYIEDFSYEQFLNTMKNKKNESVFAVIPKFNYDYELMLNEVLKEMGIPTAFSESLADFSKMGTSPNGNVYIGEVLHKTNICVDTSGTKAGAVTKVEMVDESAPMYENEVKLNRPFVYMIIDNETNLPLFMGAVTELN